MRQVAHPGMTRERPAPSGASRNDEGETRAWPLARTIAVHSSPASRNVPSIIGTQRPPTWLATTTPFSLADAGQQQARSSEVDALPDPQRQLGITLAGEIGEQCGGGGGGAAGGGILGKAARSRMKHPRLQVARLLGGGHVARVEVDRIAAVAGKDLRERIRVRPRPPQRLAAAKLHGQKRQPDRDDLRRMPVDADIGGRQRQAGRGLRGAERTSAAAASAVP